jgi:tRNA modification GTPase
MMDYRDTIYAVASGVGKSAVAIVRVSGPACGEILDRICPGTAFPARQAVIASLRESAGTLIDRALVIRFVGPASFTGEDVVEFQVTGSRAVVAELMRSLGTFVHVRPAEAGEFARRAFENGKLDLVEVEGLAALVAAETKAQMRFAQNMAFGVVSERYEKARTALVRAMSDVTSMLDFSDVEDADSLSLAGIYESIRLAKSILAAMVERSELAERLREGMIVALAGPPNVGKSTLLNSLARREVALVSPIPGTTRDSLEVFADLGGFPVVIVDTAGIRETSDPLEAQGIARTFRKISDADLVLWLADDGTCEPSDECAGRPIIMVRTKLDKSGVDAPKTGEIGISALTGFGIDRLVREIRAVAEDYFSQAGSIVAGTERQRLAINSAVSALSAAESHDGSTLELMAEELQHAAVCLGRLTGRIGVEEVLDDVFSRLCVGK